MPDLTYNASELTITNLLPSLVSEQDESFPDDLVGATIVQLGSPRSGAGIEGGGLVIDYRPHNESDMRRLVLGFTELGMWIEYHGIAGEEP